MYKLLLVVFFLTTNALAANLNLNDLKIADLSGKKVKLEKKAKIVFLWASWCPHCKKVLPYWVSQNKNLDPEIFYISADDDVKAWKESASNYKVRKHYLAKAEENSALAVFKFPSVLIVNNKNEVISTYSVWNEESSNAALKRFEAEPTRDIP